jgi:hypothetical protein
MTTDNPNVDDDGASGTPSPQVSTPAIEDADTLSKLLDAKLSEALKPLYGEIRGVQGVADKTAKAQREFVEEYEKQKASGKNNAEATAAATSTLDERKKAAQREGLLDLIAEKLGVLPNQPAGNGAGGAVDVAEVATKFGLNPKDPEVIVGLLTKKYDTPESAELAVRRFADKQAGKPQPSESDRLSAATQKPAPEKLTQEDFKKDMRAAPRGPKGDTERAAIRKKYQEGDIDVYNVDFT